MPYGSRQGMMHARSAAVMNGGAARAGHGGRRRSQTRTSNAARYPVPAGTPNMTHRTRKGGRLAGALDPLNRFTEDLAYGSGALSGVARFVEDTFIPESAADIAMGALPGGAAGRSIKRGVSAVRRPSPRVVMGRGRGSVVVGTKATPIEKYPERLNPERLVPNTTPVRPGRPGPQSRPGRPGAQRQADPFDDPFSEHGQLNAAVEAHRQARREQEILGNMPGMRGLLREAPPTPYTPPPRGGLMARYRRTYTDDINERRPLQERIGMGVGGRRRSDAVAARRLRDTQQARLLDETIAGMQRDPFTGSVIRRPR